MSTRPPERPQRARRGSGWWGRMHPEAQRQRLEMLVGIFGFFTLAAFVSAVVTEVQGNSAVIPALVLLGFALALWFTVRAWRAH